MGTSQDNTLSLLSVAAEEGHESRSNIANTEYATREPKLGKETTTSTGGEEPMDTTRVEKPMDPIPQENKPPDSAEKVHELPESHITEDAAHTKSEAATAHASHGEEEDTVDNDAKDEPPCFSVKSSLCKEDLLDHIRGTIYGNCIGDAIGLLTEFMTKEEVERIYHKKSKFQKVKEMLLHRLDHHDKLPELEYSMKSSDLHRDKWATGDWTDDSDQMILILLSLVANKGKIDPVDFAKRLKKWCKEGFKELGDDGGSGIGRTTHGVLHHPQFLTDPHEAATYVWESSGRYLAPNGGVMRTSILGIHDFGNIDEVIANTMSACKVTHADPRCVASCIAVTTAIAIMLQGKHLEKSEGNYIDAVINEAYEYARNMLETEPEREELKKYMFAESLHDLELSGNGKIGYTYKCMGAGFWSLRQDNFRDALEAVTYEGGDADTNGAVAGALLGCKLGVRALPPTWLNGLKHKEWLDKHISSFLALLGLNDGRKSP